MDCRWLYFPKFDIAVALLPKCGSSSIGAAFHKPYIENKSTEEILDASIRLAWVRQPWARWTSIFSFFHYMWEIHSYGKSDHKSQVNAETYEGFVDHTFATDDRHWMPQTELLTFEGEFVPTQVHRFETIMETWPLYMPGHLPWLRASSHKEFDETYRRDEINFRYQKDDRLWLSA